MRMVTRTTKCELQGRAENGAILVWFALMVVVLLAIAALAVDLGYGYAVKRELSTTADAASLAGAQAAGRQFKGVDGCKDDPSDPSDDYSDPLKKLAIDAALETHQSNAPAGTAGRDPDIQVQCKGKSGLPATGESVASVEVTVDESGLIDTFFGRVLGVQTLNPRATATARAIGAKNLTGLRPFLVCLPDAQGAASTVKDVPQPVYQSFYAQPDPRGEPSIEDLLVDDAQADAKKNVIAKKGHNLGDLQYVRVVGDGVPDGFYYVRTSGLPSVTKPLDQFLLSSTKSSAPVAVADGTIDVYKVSDDSSAGQWAINGTLNHSLTEIPNPGSVIRLTDLAGAYDGFYTVADTPAPTSTTLQLLDDTGVLATPAAQTPVTIYVLSSPSGDCTPAPSPANWGYSAFDFKSGSQVQLLCLIIHGYGYNEPGSDCADQGEPGVNLGDELQAVPSEGDNGNTLQNSAADEIDKLVGTAILLPVGSGWNAGGGNNAEYSGHGAIAVELCGYVMPKNKNDGLLANAPRKKFDTEASGDEGEIPECGTAAQTAYKLVEADIKDTSLAIQWRYLDDWVTSYIGQSVAAEDQCVLRGDLCVAAIQLLK